MAIGFTMAKSDEMLFATPGYWILRLVFIVFLPLSEPADTGCIFRIGVELSIFHGVFPKFVLKVFSTNGAERGGTENCERKMPEKLLSILNICATLMHFL
jgi:hypothetical protein